MKKLLVGAVAGLALIAGQAAASSDSAVVRQGDRVAAHSKTANDVFGVDPLLLVVGVAAVATVIIIAANHHHDHPTSP